MFKINIQNIYGEKGKEWIANLAATVDVLAKHWRLTSLVPVDNMSFHYVVKAFTQDNQPVVLKIGCDQKSISAEKQALKYFNGVGAILLLDDYPKYNALLLQQAEPGISLKSLYSLQPENAMDCYVDVMRKLHSQSGTMPRRCIHINNWLESIDRCVSNQIPQPLLKKAIHLKNKLLQTLTREIFLHGDLHHDNVIKNNDQWVAIDPKGVVGEAEFEIAAFDFLYVHNLADISDVKAIFETKVTQLAKKSHLDARRMKDWVFVRLILMAVWQIEDKENPDAAIKLAKMLS